MQALTWHSCGVAETPDSARLRPLVDRMFSEVLTAEERAELLEWITAWEAENPDAPAAQRVTGWIDVAYAFQASKAPGARASARLPRFVRPREA